MKNLVALLIIGIILFGMMFLRSCNYLYMVPPQIPISIEPVQTVLADMEEPLFTHVVEKDIPIKDYFNWIESLVITYDSLLPYDLSEQLWVHANPWIIDSFAHTDYYHQINQGNFLYDQKESIVLRMGDSLHLPSERLAQKLEKQLASIHIDVNLPEYTLRMLQKDSILLTFPIRIGQHRTKYLETEGRNVDLHTIIGRGIICNFIYQPKYINFNTGEEYKFTRRDDNKTTLMPLIPTLEPEINGLCHGQLIHPTTNPNTLGKAYSHGCMGTREQDAWRIYFYSRVGTPITIRYDLKVLDELGDTLVLPDVYELNTDQPFK